MNNILLRGTVFWIWAVLLLSSPLLRAQRGNPEVQFEGQGVDQMIAAFMKEHQVPGMALAIVQAPYVTRVTGYGLSDPEKKLLVSARTLFPLGVMQEAFTAVAVIQLVEAGKIKLEDPLGNYLKNLPPAWRKISVLDVLRQASGIPALPPGSGGWAKGAALPLEFEPGTKISRSATNTLLLQQLIGQASGMGYGEFVRKGQIEKLGLRETWFTGSLPKSEAKEMKGPHKDFLKVPDLIHPLETASGSPRGKGPVEPALWASALDVSIWDMGLAGGILIRSPELRKVLYAPATLKGGKTAASSGIWDFPGRPGLMVIEGSGSGFSVLLSRYTAPSDLLCVTLLANREGLDLAPLARRIAAAFDARLAKNE